MTRVLVAPDKFKGSLDAAGVAAALARGIAAAAPDVEVACAPVADGGDGTLEVLANAGFVPVPVRVDGPTGVRLDSAYARRGDVAVVELARLVGLQVLPGGELAPLDASTVGLGQAIARAVEDGCRTVLVALGGSAGTDGGAGMLQALGAQVVDDGGAPVPRGARCLAGVRRADLAGASELLDGVEVHALCDVDNPLLGPRGAAAVFGPQKGVASDDVARVDGWLARWADVVAASVGRDLRDVPGAGAAGGTAFALLALRARVRSGAEAVLELLGLPDAVRDADLVVVGEGSLDEQTLGGKAPAAVAALARSAGVPVVAVAGRATLTPAQVEAAGIAGVHQLAELEPDPVRSHRHAAELLERVGRRIGTERSVLRSVGGGTQSSVDAPGPATAYRAAMVRTASSTT
ncbi:glycerate kinase [Isoptericola sp. F-RaC21]|uniref:glycerate kinase n=1 Tax=Isoptericola sp. F-RaC21 TaxID=3141452 RepID=UPI00315BEF1E